MKRAILPTVIAWIIGVTFLMVCACLTRSESYRTSQPVREFFQALMLFGGAVAIVVFPTCLFVVTPLLRFLPSSSLLWRPAIASVIGAAAAPFAMYFWAAGYLRHAFTPDFRDEAHLIFASASILVGATFAFLYATSIRNARNA